MALRSFYMSRATKPTPKRHTRDVAFETSLPIYGI